MINAPAQPEQRIAVGQLQRSVTAIFTRCGMQPTDAAQLAGSLVFADLSGIHSHGVLRVPEYVKKLTTGGVNPQGQPTIVRDSGACMVVDGGNSMGQNLCSHTFGSTARRRLWG